MCLCQMFQTVSAVMSTMERAQRFNFGMLHIFGETTASVANVTAQSDIGVRLPNVKQVFPDVRLITVSSETDAKNAAVRCDRCVRSVQLCIIFWSFLLLHERRVCRSAAENGRRGAKQTRRWKNKRNENVSPH